MISQEIIIREKEYLVNVLGKKLIDSEERNDNPGGWGSKRGYTILVHKYWPEEFVDGKRKHVHHINFDPSDNRVCNLVVLTAKEHRTVHVLFDPSYDEVREKISANTKGENNGMYGKGYLVKGERSGSYGKENVNKNTKWMTNGIDEMRVFPPWDQDMLIFGWKYGRSPKN